MSQGVFGVGYADDLQHGLSIFAVYWHAIGVFLAYMHSSMHIYICWCWHINI